MTQLAEFLFPAPAERRAGAIVSWWEKRRLAYNVWVGAAGPVVEIVANKIWGRSLLPVGPALYRMGLTFSVGLALFPVMIMVIGWMISTVRHIF